jgi:hypothetical protein
MTQKTKKIALILIKLYALFSMMFFTLFLLSIHDGFRILMIRSLYKALGYMHDIF